MAVIPVVQDILNTRPDTIRFTWSGLSAGDTGQPISVAGFGHASLQGVGSGSGSFEGSNDGSTFAFIVGYTAGGVLTLSINSVSLNQSNALPVMVRPVLDAGGPATVIFVVTQLPR